jgi:hypothetical protein
MGWDGMGSAKGTTAGRVEPPPTCQTEALDQLNCLLGQSYPHRLHLAHCWMAFLWGKIIPETSTAQHQILGAEQLPHTPALETPKHKGKMDCVGICQPVLHAWSSHCLCACFFDPEEFPVLLSSMLDSGCILAGPCTRGYFETCEDIPAGFSFCLPNNYDSIVRMLSALTHCGVAFKSSWDFLSDLLTFKRSAITVSVAELIKFRASQDLGGMSTDLDGCTFGDSGLLYKNVKDLMETIYTETLSYVNKTTGSNLRSLKELSNTEQEVKIRRLGSRIKEIHYQARAADEAHRTVLTCGNCPLDSSRLSLDSTMSLNRCY